MAALDWLESARDVVNSDPEFRALGSSEVRVAFKAGNVARLVEFDAFAVASIRDLDAADLRDADVVIDMPARDWTSYLKQRGKGTGRSLLSLDHDKSIVSGESPLLKLKFERYQSTIQAYVDAGAPSS